MVEKREKNMSQVEEEHTAKREETIVNCLTESEPLDVGEIANKTGYHREEIYSFIATLLDAQRIVAFDPTIAGTGWHTMLYSTPDRANYYDTEDKEES
jgi:hypothetical protein